jgi:hypothetical protein
VLASTDQKLRAGARGVGMKKLALLAVLVLIPGVHAFAQSSIDDEINAELDKMYERQNRQLPNIQVNVQTNPVATSNPVVSQNNDQANDQRQKTALKSEIQADSSAQNKADSQSESAAVNKTDAKADAAAANKTDNKAGSNAQNRTDAKTVSVAKPITAVENKPVTTVENTEPKSNLSDRVEALRRSRQDEERRTDLQLAEKLEQARIEDERRRSEQILGDKYYIIKQGEKGTITIGNGNQDTRQETKVDNTAIGNSGPVNQQATTGQAEKGTAVVQPKVVQQPIETKVKDGTATVVAPVDMKEDIKDSKIVEPVVVEEKKEAKREKKHVEKIEKIEKVEKRDDDDVDSRVVIEEIRKEEKEREKQSYVSGLIGIGSYSQVQNVTGQYAVGAGFGTELNRHLMIEGDFTYSNYQITQPDNGPYGYYNSWSPRVTEMNQYQLGALLKYRFLDGIVHPTVGGVLAYSYRTYNDIQNGFPNNNGSSSAIDAGFVIGVDFDLTKTFALGLDYRYLMNLYNKANNNVDPWYYNSSTAIESYSYQLLSLVGRFSF